MANKVPSILSVSYDEALLRTRRWILETVGFKVTSAFGFAQATTHLQANRFDLVIIGHSIPREDKEALLKIVKAHQHSRILSLRRAGDLPLTDVDDSIDAFEGPEVLISAVRKLLNTEAAPEST